MEPWHGTEHCTAIGPVSVRPAPDIGMHMRLEPPSAPPARGRQHPDIVDYAERPLEGDGGFKPRILLLTSGLGSGHVRAAQGVAAALEGCAEARILDLWSLVNPGAAVVIHETYLRLVQEHPDLYERLYRLDERTWRQILQSKSGPPAQVLEVLELISRIAAQAGASAPRGGRYASDRMLLSLLSAALPYDRGSLGGNGVLARLVVMKWTWLRLIRRLAPAVREFRPDAIICTQMIPAAMVSFLKKRGKIVAPLIGVMTDFGIHDFWKQNGIARYCVPHESIAAHVNRRNVVATGVPLMPHFAVPCSQQEARRELGLPQDASVALVLGGGLGLSVDTVAQALLSLASVPHLLVLPGKNVSARMALAAIAARHPERLRVYDWTERMDLFMRAADLVVGKPGGVTVAEALACGRPLLATRSLGGQEGFNVQFLERNGVGGLVSDRDLPERVMQLLEDRGALVQMQRRAWLLGRRDGAAQVAAMAIQLATARVQRAAR